MHLAIAITFFFRHSRLQYLRQVCEAHRQLNVEYTTFIITNTSNVCEISSIREHALSDDLHIITPTYLGHPYLLTWSHRDVFREQISNGSSYSHFLYTEDDLLFTKQNLDYWLGARESLGSTPFIPGFLRWEINNRGETVSTDITEPQALSSTPLFKVGDSTFASLKEPYQGMYFLDKQLAVEFLFSNASSPDTGIWEIREKAAQGLTYWSVPTGVYSRIMIGLTQEMQIHPHAQIHHLPNNYADNPNSPHGKIPVDSILY